jgi:hypothetical protein
MFMRPGIASVRSSVYRLRLLSHSAAAQRLGEHIMRDQIQSPDPASWTAIKDVDLQQVVRPIMFGTDSPAHRQAAREAIARNVTYLSRLDHDHETLFGLLTPELAQQLEIAVSLHYDTNKAMGSPVQRHYQWKLAAALAHIGAMVLQEFMDDIDKEIRQAVAEQEVEDAACL